MKVFSSLIVILLIAACAGEPNAERLETATQAEQIPGHPQEKQPSTLNASILAGFEVEESNFNYDLSKENNFTTPKGSKIKVPKRAFKRKNGEEAKGKIQVVMKEYHTPGEIIASGIPMVYETPQGEKQQFESAGMFEILAFQGGEELELNNGKKIDVQLATYDKGTYNFYSFEKDNMNWKLEASNNKPVPNPEIKKQAEELAAIESNPAPKPKKLIAYKPSDKLFDIFVNLYKYPEFAPINGVMWKYTGTNPKADPGNNPQVFDQKYELVSMLPKESENLDYNLFLVKGKDTLKIEAAPVFQGKLMDRKNKEFAAMMHTFNEQLVRADKLRKQAKSEAQLLRQFSLDKMGIYNYDRQFKDDNAIPMLASFDFDGNLKKEDEESVGVYLIPSQKNVVIRYEQSSFKLFALNPRENNRLIAILPDNQVYVLSDKDIRAMQINRSMEGNKIVFKMKPYKSKVTTPGKLDEILAAL